MVSVARLGECQRRRAGAATVRHVIGTAEDDGVAYEAA